MSAIAGLLNVDGRPADSELLARMLDRLITRGPHGQSQWTDGPVGLAHRLLHTTPESLKERYPVSDARGECWLVWDGRVDNRDELLAVLKAEGVALGSETDPELLLHAYRQWGTGGLGRIVGEFALALWDSRTRSLVCARDPIGVKPLYYHWDGRRLVFASEVKALLEDRAIGLRPCEPMIADYLLMGFRDPEATFFEGVKQIRPGHLLRLENGTIIHERYWDVDPTRETRYAREEDYLEQFRDLFQKAVRCRLRSHSPVGVLLSGGIDSTSITTMAEVIRCRDADVPPLKAFTVLPPGFLQEEWDAIQGLIDTYGTCLHTIRQEGPNGPLTVFELYLTGSETLHYNAFMTLPLTLKPIAANGGSVLLTGFGADELFQGAEFGVLEDLLRAGQFRRLRSNIALLRHAYAGDADEEPRLLKNLFWAQLPTQLRRLIKSLVGRQVPRWIEPSFARRVDLDKRVMPQHPRRFPSYCQEESYRAIVCPAMALSLNWMDAVCAAHSLECRHPFLDRRIIEFVLSIPADVTVPGAFRKMFLQRALQSMTAGPIRPRMGTSCYIPPLDPYVEKARDAARLRQNLLHPDALVYRYVTQSEAEKIQARYLAGDVRSRTLLWQFGNLEQWLREFFPERVAA